MQHQTEILLSINLLLCTSSRVLTVMQIMWEKPKERYMNDVLSIHRVIEIGLPKIASTSVLKCSTYLILPVKVQNSSQMISILEMLIIETHVPI